MQKKLDKISLAVFFIFVLLAFGMLADTTKYRTPRYIDYINCNRLYGNLEYVNLKTNESGVVEQGESVKNVGKNDTVRFTLEIAEPIRKYESITFRTDFLLVKVYSGDRVIYSYGDEEAFPSYLHSVGTRWHSIFLESGFSGKIYVDLKADSTGHDILLGPVYKTTSGAFFYNMIEQEAGYFVISFIVLFVGIIVCAISIILFFQRLTAAKFVALGLLTMWGGLWLISDNAIVAAFAASPSAVYIFNNMFHFSIVIPFILYIRLAYNPRGKEALKILFYVDVLFFSVATLLQLLGVCDYSELSFINSIITHTNVLVAFSTLVYDYYKNRERSVMFFFASIIAFLGFLVPNVITRDADMRFEPSFLVFITIITIDALFKFKDLLLMKNNQEHLVKLAYKDSLTGIRNRTAYNELVNFHYNKLDEINNFGVIVCDLNNLKTLNDVYGHNIGDLAILAASREICVTFSMFDVFRVGGDEFIVITKNYPKEFVEDLVQEINKLTIPLETPLGEKLISISAGVSFYDKAKDENVDDIIHRADKDMYRNKRTNKIKR